MIEDPTVIELRNLVHTENFLVANLFEANMSLDAIGNGTVAVYLMPDKSKNKLINGLLIRTVPINLMFLNSLSLLELDITTEQVDPYINEMRMISQQFIYRLNKAYVTYKHVEEWTTDKVYAKFDSLLYGVAISFDWEFNTQKGICNPNLI